MISASEIQQWYIREFSTKKKQDAFRKKDKILFVGNGISRLAQTKSGTSLYSWKEWVKECWDEIKPKLPFDFVLLRGLSLPECVTLLEKTAEQAPDATKKLKILYRKLWDMFELEAAPETLIHNYIVDNFDYFITTNYDTLIERTARSMGHEIEVHVVGSCHVMEKPIVRFPNLRKRKTIIKLHGSFPLQWMRDKDNKNPTDSSFKTWFNDELYKNLIISSLGYGSENNEQRKQQRARLGECSNSLGNKPVIIIGFGMAFEDYLVKEFLKNYIESDVLKAMTYGGDEIDNFRFSDQHGIKHCSISDSHGGGRHSRIKAHKQFLMQIQEGSCENASETFHKEAIFEKNRAVLVGQSSVQYITRIKKPPVQERSYPAEYGPFYLNEVLGDGYFEKQYDLKQVGGQMLIPATFLSKWGFPITLASAVGYDQYGHDILNYLREDINTKIDWRFVKVDRKIITDHSYVATTGDIRILFDCGNSQRVEEVANSFKKDLINTFNKEEIIPTVLYLSKWYLKDCAKDFEQWCLKIDQNKRPLVLYDTGTGAGSNGPDKFDGKHIGKFCDIMLSSSLFVLRLTKLPLYQKKNNVLFEAPLDEGEWWDIFDKKLQPSDSENRAYQNGALILGLQYLNDIEEFRKRLFSETFKNVSWWIITLGSGGMLVFSRDQNYKSMWIPAPIEIRENKKTRLNALGCGDVSRAGFIGSFLNSNQGRTTFLKNPNLIKAATKFAVVAGSYKINYFELKKAIEELTWNLLNEKVDDIDDYPLESLNILEEIKIHLKIEDWLINDPELKDYSDLLKEKDN